MTSKPTAQTCFVISPIGDKKSETRAEADKLLWAINQAVSKSGFNVVRIDEIAKTHEITREIVRLINDSELCVIILTGNNPNVFYEAGRRHQLGKPYIHLLREGEKLPFDVAAINTIHYGNISEFEPMQDLVAAIESFVEASAEEISGARQKDAVTLEIIADGISRIEKRLDRVPAVNVGSNSRQSDMALGDPAISLKNPREAFMLAIAGGNVERASALLPKLKGILGQNNSEYLHALMMCAAGCSHEAALELRGWLAEYVSTASASDIVHAVGSLVNYYSITDREAEAIDSLFPSIDQALSRSDISKSEQIQLINQKQRIYYGAERYELALEQAEKIIATEPDEPAYYFNAGLIYKKLNLMNKASDMVSKMLNKGADDEDHLALAVEVFRAVNEIDRAKKALADLHQLHPAHARLLMMKKEYRDLL